MLGIDGDGKGLERVFWKTKSKTQSKHLRLELA